MDKVPECPPESVGTWESLLGHIAGKNMAPYTEIIKGKVARRNKEGGVIADAPLVSQVTVRIRVPFAGHGYQLPEGETERMRNFTTFLAARISAMAGADDPLRKALEGANAEQIVVEVIDNGHNKKGGKRGKKARAVNQPFQLATATL